MTILCKPSIQELPAQFPGGEFIDLVLSDLCTTLEKQEAFVKVSDHKTVLTKTKLKMYEFV